MMSKIIPRQVSAVGYGVVAALLAVGVQIFFRVQPPPAYGICLACHPRDMVAWLANQAFGANWEIAPVSTTFPLLTTIGVLIGAYLAARRNQEIRWVSLGKPWRSFIYGLLVMNAAILVLGCPTRLVLFSAYGEGLAMLGVVGVVIGITLGTWLLERGIFY
ncbi:MAG: cytochrome C [Anaerolineae bacterium]